MNAAVRAVFIFWPALKRPCGAGLRPAQPAQVVAVEAVDLARGAQEPAPVAESTISDEHATQATPDQKWMSLDERAAPDQRPRGSAGRG